MACKLFSVISGDHMDPSRVVLHDLNRFSHDTGSVFRGNFSQYGQS